MRKYQSTRKIIVIQAPNNFTAHGLLNSYARVMLDIFCYYITNNWKNLIDQENAKNTTSIATPILTTIYIHIGSTKFLEKRLFEIEYDADNAICERCPCLD